MSERDLYPPIEPYDSGVLTVEPPHRLYWEVSGNPDGAPVIFLHGGPGAGASPDHRRFFDPAHYRIVVFDQRGAGRSEPLGSLENNTTQALIGDIEALRSHLGIERWQVFGGSWGSTLALAYAQAHPDRVSALVLRGIFLARAAEIDWFMTQMGQIFPEAREKFTSFIPEGERGDLLGAYHRRLQSEDKEVQLAAARAWSLYEGACSTLLSDSATIAAHGESRMAIGLARMEVHYFVNRCFVEEGALLEGVQKIRHIPSVIVQGRYDIICPIVSARDLHKAWPESELQIIPDAGHSAMEPGIRRALVAATDKFRTVCEKAA
ncbi:MAG: prolyl aminopeptidase [Pseudomonadota bacterium]